MGVWLEFTFAVKSIFRYFMTGTPEIDRVYAVFSPVLPDTPLENPPPLGLSSPSHDYMLCYAYSLPWLFNSSLSSLFRYPIPSVGGHPSCLLVKTPGISFANTRNPRVSASTCLPS